MSNIDYKIIHEYFDNLRDLNIYLSSFSFYVSQLKDKADFSVNPNDLLLIECMRVFEPDVYKAISYEKLLLTAEQGNKKALNKWRESVINKAGDSRQLLVKITIDQLFPIFTHSIHSVTDSIRISTTTGFDNYFLFSTYNDKPSYA